MLEGADEGVLSRHGRYSQHSRYEQDARRVKEEGDSKRGCGIDAIRACEMGNCLGHGKSEHVNHKKHEVEQSFHKRM